MNAKIFTFSAPIDMVVFNEENPSEIQKVKAGEIIFAVATVNGIVVEEKKVGIVGFGRMDSAIGAKVAAVIAQGFIAA